MPKFVVYLCIAGFFCIGDVAAASLNLRVCVLNDSQFPVKAERVMPLLLPLVAELESRAEISLTFQGIRNYSGPVVPLTPELQIAALNRACADCEMKVLMTNRLRVTEAGVRLSGECQPDHGYIILYDTDHGLTQRDRGGNVQVLTTLRHEIGHLLGADHTSDKASFMYAQPHLSQGRWTDAVAEQIRSRKQYLTNEQ